MRRSHLWVLVVTVFLVIWGLTTHGKYSASGDEPHYLIVTESLRSDGDLDLLNNYEARAGQRFGREDLEAGPHARVDRYGALLPVHDVGLPVLLLPIYSLAVQAAEFVPQSTLVRFRMNRGLFAYSLVSLWTLAVCCVGLWLLGRAVAEHVPGWHAVVLLGGLALSPPVLTNAFLIFPEAPAFLVCCLAVWASFGRDRARGWRAALALCAIGLLPWFHRKFVLFGFALAAVLIWANWDEVKTRVSVWTAGVVLLIGLPLAGLMAWSVVHWGSPGGALVIEGAPFSWRAFRTGLLGLVVDRENGLLVWAPVYLLLPAAWWFTRRFTWPLLLPVLTIVMPSAAHEQWWGGFSPAGRFLMPLVPCFAAVYAIAAGRLGLRPVLLPFVVVQLFVSAYSWQHPRLFWPQGDGHNRVLEALPVLGAPLSQVLPSLRTGDDGVWSALGWLMLIVALNVAVGYRFASRRR